MKIAIGTDHRAVDQKTELAQALEKEGHEILDMSPLSTDSMDYPDFAQSVAEKVSSGKCQRGILMCGTGIGMSMAANKMRGIRAALCHNEFTTEMSRRHNDANVLCLGASVLDSSQIHALTKLWLATPFEGDRHERRIKKIMDLE